MARVHGKDARVYLGSRDISSDLSSIEVSGTIDTHDVTTFGSNDWREFDAGIGSWEASVSGFYQTNTGLTVSTIERQFESLIGSNSVGAAVLSVYMEDADGVGDSGFLCSEGVNNKFSIPVSVADVTKISGTIQGNGRMSLDARLLKPLGVISTTTTGTSYDATAASTSGGRGNLHVTAATGTGGTVKIQHSTDNSTWVDLITFTAATAATSETKTCTGSVYRYLRYQATINATSSLTFVVGFGRF